MFDDEVQVRDWTLEPNSRPRDATLLDCRQAYQDGLRAGSIGLLFNPHPDGGLAVEWLRGFYDARNDQLQFQSDEAK